ncbi:MAG: 4-phosphoerythronate dehydrogenase [Tannerella sp.]|jgi:erythronate-4-phosphate dehydrogenase|nr:4-phosphoerythronate dehydrogenase [Tannerella sp.]
MNRPKIIADDKIPFLKGALENYADIVYLPGAKTTAADVKDADVIFTRTRTKCDEKLLGGSHVKLIATATIGYDHIDTEYCDKMGIRWVNAPGCNSYSVQQYITAALATLVYERGLKFRDLTIGIIGVGNVGSKVMKAAEALGIRVLLNDPPKELAYNGLDCFVPRNDERYIETPFGERKVVSLDKLLTESDIVTCHVPLTKEEPYMTFHLANDGFFAKMKDNAVFINSSRGAVTDTEALRKAINSGKLSAFILDVWETEPTPDPELLAKAFISTPHIAGYSSDGKANGTAACIREFANYFNINELKNWYPSEIPSPPMPLTIAINGAGKSKEQIIYEAVTHTYPITEDSNRLKISPEAFEKQRGDYWIRREFKNFTIEAKNIDPQTAQSLELLGFTIK